MRACARQIGLALLLLLLADQSGGAGTSDSSSLELTAAAYSFAPAISGRARAAVQALLPSAWQQQSTAAVTALIDLRFDSTLPREDFQLQASPEGVHLAASADRGFILGAGRLLRELRVHSSGSPIVLPLPFKLELAPPAGQTRGTEFTTAIVGPASPQPGGFSTWENAERYVKELAIFGGNEVELAHPVMGDILNANLRNWSRLCGRWDAPAPANIK